ncbi:tigger transposable element-derived protein 1 [Trichonephila clavipes]|uniref:Tigger transposable element-derived protein 1 n=1 Tax=Trichonephila clavipes TaxID=2585209 RepID=A0A8X6VRE0_TRICX|nr:tigger transposable element-derived protein 1 [Trichonephila clavipes]
MIAKLPWFEEDRLGKGERSTAIEKHFNLGESTVRAIKKNEAAIRKSVISGTKLSTKFASYTRDVLLERTERAIAIWIEEQVQRRIPVSGYLIQEKALQFYKSMKLSEPSTYTSQAGKEFSASKGWLTGFFKRNALHIIKITGESSTADKGAAKIFPKELAKIIEDGDYSVDQVFNADETGLYRKKLPNRTYIAKDEKTASGHKAIKDRVTLLLCSNTSGDQMLQPLLINKSLRPRALKIWPACVTDNTTTQTSTLSDEIINLAHEIGGDGFNTFSHDDIDELLVDEALSDNDIIDLTLDLTVDGVVGLEGDDDEEEKSTPLTGKLIQEGLQLCSKLENPFLINDPNSERASELQRELQNCMSGYRELYKKIKESSSQDLITDYIVRKGRSIQNENEVCENPWPLPQISIAETVSSDDEGDLEPLRKRCKPLSDSDND